MGYLKGVRFQQSPSSAGAILNLRVQNADERIDPFLIFDSALVLRTWRF
jgi:hypothetical protein